MNIKKGYLYAATNQRYIDEAIQSVRSLRKIDKNVHTTLITDKHLNINEFDSIITLDYSEIGIDAWKNGLSFKIRAIQNSPYDHTFFLDTDTYFCESCKELFELLEYYELLIVHSPRDVNLVSVDNKTLDGYYPYNTGVIVYKKTEATKRLFEEWHRAYISSGADYDDDQAAFMKALLTNDIKLYVLHSIYNLRTMFFTSIPDAKVKIFHGRPSNLTEIIRTVNGHNYQRVWDPINEKIHFRKTANPVKLFIFNHTPKPVLNVYYYFKRLIN
ncbi:MAG: glycosyltransferase family 77 protein [Cytophagales bacterium]|nr:glycosyltransferase family 77 protein [Cytophagales bacterium]